MRISTNTIISSSLANLETTQIRLLDAQATVSTGKTLNEPSDNPSGLSQDLSIRTTLDNIEQYKRNMNDARGFVGLTDTALGQLSQQLRSARQLALQGANSTIDGQARAGLADQAHQIATEIVQIANSAYGTRYLFGGQRTTQPPYVPDGSGSWVYQGGTQATSDDNLTVAIGEIETIVVNVTGDRVFDKAFSVLSDLQAHLADGNLSRLSNDDVAAIDEALKAVTTIRAEVGSGAQRLDAASDRLEQRNVHLQEVLSHIEDADLSKAILELQTSQMSYQASLTALSRTFQNSLLEFMR